MYVYKIDIFLSILFHLKLSVAPRVTTTLIPLNICPIEYSQIVKPTPTPLVNIIENRQEHNIFENKSNDNITTHLIGDWIIRESSEPFRRKENVRSTPIEHVVDEEKNVKSNESIIRCQFLPSDINHWTVSFYSIYKQMNLCLHIDRYFFPFLLKKNEKQTRKKLYELMQSFFFFRIEFRILKKIPGLRKNTAYLSNMMLDNSINICNRFFCM